MAVKNFDLVRFRTDKPALVFRGCIVRRFSSAVIDVLVIGSIFACWALSDDHPQPTSEPSNAVEYVVGLLLLSAYYLPELLFRQTLGMWLMNLVVIPPPGRRQWISLLIRKTVNLLEFALWPVYFWVTSLRRDVSSLSDMASGCVIARKNILTGKIAAPSHPPGIGRRVSVALLFTLMPIILAGGGIGAILFHYDILTIDSPPAVPWDEQIAPERLKEDLEFAFNTIETVHPNMYAYVAEETFAEARKSLYSQISHPMTPLEFYKLLAPVICSLRGGHTGLGLPPGWREYKSAGGRFYPIEIHWYGTDVILAGYYGQGDLPLGGKILAVNDQAADAVFANLARYGASEGRKGNPWELQFDEILKSALWMEYGSTPLHLDIRLLDGRTERHVVNALTFEEVKTIALQKKPLARSATRDSARTIVGYRRFFIYRYIEEYDTALLRISKFYWGYFANFREFLAKAFKDINDRGVSNLIIDVRYNPGGARLGIYALFRYLTNKRIVLEEGDAKYWRASGRLLVPSPLVFKGRTYVLIGPHTASAAMMFAAAAKYYEVATLVGEETLEPTVLYAERRDFRLPNSGLTLCVASDRTVAVGGKADGRGVVPDYEVKQKPEDTAKWVDTVLQFTLDLIKKGI